MRAWHLAICVLVTVILQEPKAEGSHPCPKNFELHNETCYRFVDKCRTLTQAERECEKMSGATVAVPYSQAESDLLDEMASGTRTRFLVNIIYKLKKDEWRRADDNSVLPWTHWKYNDAYNKNRVNSLGHYCVMQKKKKGRSKWLVTHCNMILPFFCSKEAKLQE